MWESPANSPLPDTVYWYDSACDAARKIIDEYANDIFRQLLAKEKQSGYKGSAIWGY